MVIVMEDTVTRMPMKEVMDTAMEVMVTVMEVMVTVMVPHKENPHLRREKNIVRDCIAIGMTMMKLIRKTG